MVDNSKYMDESDVADASEMQMRVELLSLKTKLFDDSVEDFKKSTKKYNETIFDVKIKKLLSESCESSWKKLDIQQKKVAYKYFLEGIINEISSNYISKYGSNDDSLQEYLKASEAKYGEDKTNLDF